MANMDILDRMVQDGEYSLMQVRDLYDWRGENRDGYNIGHNVARRHFIEIAMRFSLTRYDMWSGWMNTTTSYLLNPGGYTPLMCLMDKPFPWKERTVFDQKAMKDLIEIVIAPRN